MQLESSVLSVAEAKEKRFTFKRLAVHRSYFQEIDRAEREEGEKRPRPVPASLQIESTIHVDEKTLQAFVLLEVKVTPDPKWQPYRIEVVTSGVFAAEAGTTEEDLKRFCKFGVPPILFPYIRETIHRMTMDAVNGPVRLEPFNVQEMINRTPWTEVPNEPASPIEP